MLCDKIRTRQKREKTSGEYLKHPYKYQLRHGRVWQDLQKSVAELQETLLEDI